MVMTPEHSSVDRGLSSGVPKQIRPTETTDLLTHLINIHDDVTAEHIGRVFLYVGLLAEKMKFSREELTDAVTAGKLHDLGKIVIPEYILTKIEPLTDEEWEIVKEHPDYGAEIAIEAGFNERVVGGIRYHHERPDGRGYPEGLSSGEIPKISKLIAIIDAWDAMLSDRPYEESLEINIVVAELIQAASVQLDQEMVIEFLKLLQEEDLSVFRDLNINRTREHRSRNYDVSRMEDYESIFRESFLFIE